MKLWNWGTFKCRNWEFWNSEALTYWNFAILKGWSFEISNLKLWILGNAEFRCWLCLFHQLIIYNEFMWNMVKGIVIICLLHLHWQSGFHACPFWHGYPRHPGPSLFPPALFRKAVREWERKNVRMQYERKDLVTVHTKNGL